MSETVLAEELVGGELRASESSPLGVDEVIGLLVADFVKVYWWDGKDRQWDEVFQFGDEIEIVGRRPQAGEGEED